MLTVPIPTSQKFFSLEKEICVWLPEAFE